MAVIINGDTGIDKITDGSVVNADIASGIDAAKLTGTLPALDASSLTGIPAPAALSTASGSAPSYSARAWVNFNGTGTVAIRDDRNVTSITDYGTGTYGVNFTTAMPNANYTVAGAIKRVSGDINARGYMYFDPRYTPTTTAVRIATNDQGQMLDMEWVTPIIMV
jgi:hypothetical protein